MPATRAAPRRVLVVEDEVLIAMEMRDLLEAGGYDVVGPVATVAAALATLVDTRPDACVLDVNLRGQNSAPVARALKQQHVPFVLASAYDRQTLDQQEDFAGVANVTKPLTPAGLLASLAALLG